MSPQRYRSLRVLTLSLPRFFSLFCIYYSLKYLSLADATVLTFLAPFCTGVAGALFLKEDFTRKEAFASCKRNPFRNHCCYCAHVISVQPLRGSAHSTACFPVWGSQRGPGFDVNG